MRLLILGGTGDGRKMAAALQPLGIELIYSVAGLVRVPEALGCEVVSGGFSASGGLQRFLIERDINAVLDCTHPYAAQMSNTAVSACRDLGLPCWRVERRTWQAQPGDHWRRVKNWEELLPMLVEAKSVFVTSGQIDSNVLAGWQRLLAGKSQRQLLRTAVEPAGPLPQSMTWLQSIGPFNIEGELQLLRDYQIDALVCKDSGGAATAAKLSAARELGVPVYLFERPLLKQADKHFFEQDDCVAHIRAYCTQ